MAELSESSSTGPAAVAAGHAVSRAEAAAIDAGVRAHMLHIYNYMALGLAVSAIAAMGIYLLSVTKDPAAAATMVRGNVVSPAHLAGDLYLTPAGYALFVSPVKWAIILAPLVLAFSLNFSIERMRPAFAQLLFWLYAALIGISLGAVFMIYTQTSTGRVFLIAAASFIALSLFGYATRRDLGGLGAFVTMGLCGIVIAGLVNFVLGSSTLQWVISATGIVVFSALTAFDSRRLKDEYIYGAMDGDTAERTAVLGAFALYLDFINLFTLLLTFSGEREE